MQFFFPCLHKKLQGPKAQNFVKQIQASVKCPKLSSYFIVACMARSVWIHISFIISYQQLFGILNSCIKFVSHSYAIFNFVSTLIWSLNIQNNIRRVPIKFFYSVICFRLAPLSNGNSLPVSRSSFAPVQNPFLPPSDCQPQTHTAFLKEICSIHSWASVRLFCRVAK